MEQMKKFYTDGSSTIGIKSAHCVTDGTGKILAFKELKYPDALSNNQEEYRGVIAALKLCKEGDEILSDSLLVVNQVKGLFKVKQPHLKPLCEQAQKLLAEKKAKLSWISRDENPAGAVFE